MICTTMIAIALSPRAFDEGTWPIIEALVVGDWAAHDSIEDVVSGPVNDREFESPGWRITHVPSGYCLPAHFDEEEAVWILGEIGKLPAPTPEDVSQHTSKIRRICTKAGARL